MLSFPLALSTNAQLQRDGLFQAINEVRTGNDLAPLQENSSLDKAAELKAEAILQYQTLSHDLPELPFFGPVQQSGYEFEVLGENLGKDYNDQGELVQQWMDSQSHRENILNPKYSETGIAVKQGMIAGVPSVIAVQYFAAPKASATSDLPTDTQPFVVVTSLLALLGLTVVRMRKFF